MLDYAGVLKRNNLRVTPQRVAILDYIMSSKAHPTAENIFEELIKIHPSLSLATVYKTLDTLKSEGVINGFSLSGESSRYDAKTDPHAHFKCLGCNSIVDVEMPRVLEHIKGEVSASNGLDIVGQQVFFFGHCFKCKKKGR